MRVTRRQRPACAYGEGGSVFHRHHDPLTVGDTVRLLHDPVDRLRVDAHRLRAFEAPENKSISCVASITAGESRIRPPILLPMERETLRLTSAVTGRSRVPFSRLCFT